MNGSGKITAVNPENHASRVRLALPSIEHCRYWDTLTCRSDFSSWIFLVTVALDGTLYPGCSELSRAMNSLSDAVEKGAEVSTIQRISCEVVLSWSLFCETIFDEIAWRQECYLWVPLCQVSMWSGVADDSAGALRSFVYLRHFLQRAVRFP